MARNGDVEIWTSTYTLAEVFKRKCEDIQTGLAADKDVVFEDFVDQDFVTYAQVDADVGRIARRLLRRFTELKKPPDAVHLATAILHNCDEFHTTDAENLLPLNGRIARLDRTPLLICRPPYPPPPPPSPPESSQRDLFSQVQDNANATSERGEEDQAATAQEEDGAAVRPSGEGTGVRRRLLDLGEQPSANSASRAGAQAPAEETEQELTEDEIEALEADEIIADLKKLEPPDADAW